MNWNKTKLADAYAVQKCRADAERYEEGQGAAEYAVVAGLILVVAVAGALIFSGAVNNLFGSASDNLNTAVNANTESDG